MAQKDESRAATICSLPTEIVRNIIKHLTRRDLKCLRLMDRRLRIAASETLFHSLTVRNISSSQTQLEQVTASSFWADQVHSVDWLSFTTRGLTRLFGADTPGFNLDRQIEHLRNLPNVRKVRFALIPSSREFDVEYGPGDSPRDLILRAHWRPAIVVIGSLLVRLGYATDGNIEWLEFGAAELQLIIIETDEPNSMDGVYETMIDNSDSIKMSENMSDFLTVTSPMLKRISLKGVPGDSGLLIAMLLAQPQMMALSLEDVLLESYCLEDLDPFPDPLEQLMMGWKAHCKQYQPVKAKITLNGVRKEGYHGILHAQTTEVIAWVEGDDGDWLKRARAAFT